MREYCKELLGNHVVIECKDKSFLTDIKTIVFEERTTTFTLLNNDKVTISNNQKLTRNNEGYIVINAISDTDLFAK